MTYFEIEIIRKNLSFHDTLSSESCIRKSRLALTQKTSLAHYVCFCYILLWNVLIPRFLYSSECQTILTENQIRYSENSKSIISISKRFARKPLDRPVINAPNDTGPKMEKWGFLKDKKSRIAKQGIKITLTVRMEVQIRRKVISVLQDFACSSASVHF